MADLNATVYSVLSNDSTLTALVGTRIWNVRRAHSEAEPAVVFSRISTLAINTAQGTDGLAGVRYQIDAYAPTLAQASQVMFAARDALVTAFKGVTLDRDDAYVDDLDIYLCSTDISLWGTDDSS